jgi:hypothetical protein
MHLKNFSTGSREIASNARMRNLKERTSKSVVNKHQAKSNKHHSNFVLPYVYTGPLYWEEQRKKRARANLPRDYYYKGTMGKIKANPMINKITIENDANSELNDTTFGDYSTFSIPNMKDSLSQKSVKMYDFQKSPAHDRREKNPELMQKLAYEDDDEFMYYSEEDLKGDEALDNYSFKYKNLYKLKQKSDVMGEQKSPLVDYLLDVDKEKKIPKALGLVNRKHNANEVVADNYLFGDNYAKSFSQGIKGRTKLEALKLNANRLTDYGFNEILMNAPNTLLILDISYNSTLTMKTYSLIAEYLDDSSTVLQQLMIEGNHTGDKPVVLLCKVLMENRSLKYLNISRNNVTDTGALAVAKMLCKNDVINVLFMHWNKIREKGGKMIANAIEDTTSLQIFDISFNNIGTLGKEHSVATALSKAFRNNTSLVHVDISNCCFDGKDIEIMNEGLIPNHNILGIHMLGNMGQTDTLGFLHKSDEVDLAMATLFTRIKPTLERGHKHNSQAVRLHAASN